MRFVSKIDKAAAVTPPVYEKHSHGFRRATYVDRATGSVHMGVGVNFLDAGGAIDSHLHSFEESFYILEGSVTAQVAGQSHVLRPGDFGLIRTGLPHSWRNESGAAARWLEMQAPQPRPSDHGTDTFFVNGSVPAEGLLLHGHFDEGQLPRPGGPSQMEGFNPTTSVALKMFVDRPSARSINRSS